MSSAGFYCAVTGRERIGTTFFPAQAKTRLQGLRSCTWNNACAIFEDHEPGSLSPGKRADLKVFSGNLPNTPADWVLRTRVLYTFVGGKFVYQRPSAEAWKHGELFKAMPEFDHVD